MGRCPTCHEWNSLESNETLVRNKIDQKLAAPRFQRINEIEKKEVSFIATGLVCVDELLGGGFTPGSTVLIGGEPGVGKSTLLLGLSAESLKQNKNLKVLYVSAEEDVGQVATRCQRLKIQNTELYLLSENCLENLEQQVDLLSPDIIIIDSAQTFYSQEINSKVGSLNQVREITNALSNIAQARGVTCVIVGHINKEKEIAGPMTIEHIVDVVLHLKVKKNSSHLVLSATKNRFAPTLRSVSFEMTQTGLREV